MQSSCGEWKAEVSLKTLQPWTESELSAVDEVVPFVETVSATLSEMGYTRNDVFGVRLALEEALVNAIKHGHRHDPSRLVKVRSWLTRGAAVLEIEDQGEGFDVSDLPDPTAVENLERSCGRGVYLMQSYMSWIRYNDRGNCVTLCKYPSATQVAK